LLPLVSAVESPPFPFEPASADRVRVALTEAVRRHADALDALHAAIGDCVRCLRLQGMTPEATLLTMKAFIRHTAAKHPAAGRHSQWLPEPLLENIVRWCINDYFRRD
jgi:hypothetical protein